MRGFVLPPFRVAAAFVVAMATVACDPHDGAAPHADEVGAAPGFAEQAAQFPRGVREVAPGVHVAVGYGLANSVLLTGDGGNVIVDTMESAEAAGAVRDEFRRISPAPLAAIVYTHNHADHVFGAAVLAGSDHPEVIAHRSFAAELARVAMTRDLVWRRAMRQFGVFVPDELRLHCGVGPRLDEGPGGTLAPLAPTRLFDGERLELTIAGMHLVLLHLPGETPDQVAVWLPDKRVLVSGDNWYHSFPNLYAIRGTPVRDVAQWIASLDAMRALDAEVLVPGHTLPVTGAGAIRERLTDTRDAIQFLHDQTLRLMNQGKNVDEIVELVRLPKSLADKPWLAERYGRVDWSVRGIFDATVGWFGGDAAELAPLSRKERAQHLATMAGGSDHLRDAARRALKNGDLGWALELAGHLDALGEFHAVAARVRAASLRRLAAEEPSANGRNWYLSAALEAEEKIVLQPPDASETPAPLLAAMPMADLLRAMTLHLNPDKADGKRLAVGFRFTDTGEEWGMTLRNSIVELEPRLPGTPDMTVTTDTATWKDVLTRKRNATAAFARGDVKVDRNRLELVRFLFLFR